MRSCPKCKGNDYSNRKFVLRINICGHSLCESCVDTLFIRNSAPCPTCGKTLRKNAFWDQVFDDPMVEKEVYWRKKLSKIFCLKEDDFDSLREYNDYLEKLENLVWNKVNDVDPDETQRRIDDFESANASQIETSRSKKSADEIWIRKQLDEERFAHDRHKEIVAHKVATAPEVSGIKQEAELQNKLISELINSNQSADLLIAKHRNERTIEQQIVTTLPQQPQPSQPSLFFNPTTSQPSLSTLRTSSFVVTDSVDEPYTLELYDINQQLNGPSIMTDLSDYLRNVQEADMIQKTGGYTSDLACRRALLDAFSGLWSVEY